MLFKKNISDKSLSSLHYVNLINKIDQKEQQDFQRSSDKEIKKWRTIFLHRIQKQRFIIFKDDFDLENLNTEDLEKIQKFASNWLIENIIFFNNSQESDIYPNQHEIIEQLQLTGFWKESNMIFNLFFNFKIENQNEMKHKRIKITFEIFNDVKETFVNFFNEELQTQFLKNREPNFKNENYNIREWSRTRTDFFWKIPLWILGFKEIANDIIEKINQKFSTTITKSNNVLFFSWNASNDNFKVDLSFIYHRFDLQVKTFFKFKNFSDEDFNEKTAKWFEKNVVSNSLGIKLEDKIEHDYEIKISKDLFVQVDYFDRYLDIYIDLTTVAQTIKKAWSYYFVALKITSRIENYETDFDFEKMQTLDFGQSGYFYIKIIFSTIQNNQFTRILRIDW